MDEVSFHYSAACSSNGCPEPPRFKIAAPWGYGPLRELKNYGLACAAHVDDQVARARGRRETLAVNEDEFVGPIEVFPFSPGQFVGGATDRDG